jgi:Phycobilisome Linker polypeptide
MTAFIAPATVSQSAFVGRAVSTSSVRGQQPEIQTTPTTAALKLPKMPSMPSMPKMPKMPSMPISLPKPGLPSFGKKVPVAKAPAAAVKVAGKVARAMPKKSDSRTTRAAASAPSSVKFYNSATARYVFSADSKGHGATAFDVRVGGAAASEQFANENGTFRNMSEYQPDLLCSYPGWSPAEADVAVRSVFRNILGNAYLLEEELSTLASEISCYKETAETKEFVRSIALSDSYRSRFFFSCSNMRFVEIIFKHFLGRAPRTQAEVSEKIQLLAAAGYNAVINSMVDCDEYDILWGDRRVPQPNFRGGHQYNKDMNTLAILSGGYSKSDRLTTKAVFATGDSSGSSSGAVLKGLPEAWRGENAARDAAGPIRQFPSSKFWNPVQEDSRAAELAWKAKFGGKWWYSQSAVFKDVMKPKLSNASEEVAEAVADLKYGSTMAKFYSSGPKFTWSVAPVIDITPPTSTGAKNGIVSLAMKEIFFAIPSDLEQANAADEPVSASLFR